MATKVDYDDLFDQFNQLDGEEQEQFLTSLPAEEQAELRKRSALNEDASEGQQDSWSTRPPDPFATAACIPTPATNDFQEDKSRKTSRGFHG